jgi:uncharacterized protein (TIGR00255 family)
MASNLQSMTGFGRGEKESENFRITTEIKSVNNRYKDFRFRMPNLLNKQEITFKNKISESCKRGTFDISINLKKSQTQNSMKDIDFEKVNAFLKDFIELTSAQKGMAVNCQPTDFLRNEFYMDLEDQEEEILALAKESFGLAIESLLESRKGEGEKLKDVLNNHLDRYKEHFTVIKGNADKFNQMVKDRLDEKFKEHASEINVDEPRFLQEVIYYMEKMDIHEEINRIETHLGKLEKVLAEKTEVGREIEFLLQELNRETNTIGSKSANTDQSDNVVKMKVQLEKMREQGLNLQ